MKSPEFGHVLDQGSLNVAGWRFGIRMLAICRVLKYPLWLLFDMVTGGFCISRVGV